ncbi:unnamed protein product [Phytophthora lilii]|uniref:Unnamed protein product n=1 Tax=Phytophthora lilii TaxID=2077276 RepID=A0A9W6X1E1_9STRA|nr:unnamed protein product [Phytophthora lilii]
MWTKQAPRPGPDDDPSTTTLATSTPRSWRRAGSSGSGTQCPALSDSTQLRYRWRPISTIFFVQRGFEFKSQLDSKSFQDLFFCNGAKTQKKMQTLFLRVFLRYKGNWWERVFGLALQERINTLRHTQAAAPDSPPTMMSQDPEVESGHFENNTRAERMAVEAERALLKREAKKTQVLAAELGGVLAGFNDGVKHLNQHAAFMASVAETVLSVKKRLSALEKRVTKMDERLAATDRRVADALTKLSDNAATLNANFVVTMKAVSGKLKGRGRPKTSARKSAAAPYAPIQPRPSIGAACDGILGYSPSDDDVVRHRGRAQPDCATCAAPVPPPLFTRTASLTGSVPARRVRFAADPRPALQPAPPRSRTPTDLLSSEPQQAPSAQFIPSSSSAAALKKAARTAQQTMRASVIENKLLASSGLMDEPQFRRLIKFQTRRREALVGSELEIRITTSHVLASDKSFGGWFTVYCMHIRRAAEFRDGADDQWVMKKRFSELHTFRRLLLKRIADWEQTVRREFTRKTAVDRRQTLAIVSNAMRRAISPSFPKKRMRPDAPAVVKERVVGLPNFVRKLLGVYTDLAVYRTNRQLQADGFASSWTKLCTILSELEAFLEIPQPQKDAEIQRQSAVLALKDFSECDSVNESTHDLLCSICLNEDPSADETRPMVSLPCDHHFHEDCVIDWFSTSTTCPLCRRSLHS